MLIRGSCVNLSDCNSARGESLDWQKDRREEGGERERGKQEKVDEGSE